MKTKQVNIINSVCPSSCIFNFQFTSLWQQYLQQSHFVSLLLISSYHHGHKYLSCSPTESCLCLPPHLIENKAAISFSNYYFFMLMEALTCFHNQYQCTFGKTLLSFILLLHYIPVRQSLYF